jgi:hypothetical protein
MISKPFLMVDLYEWMSTGRHPRLVGRNTIENFPKEL